MKKTYHREADGTTYWEDAGLIWGAPTHLDGTFDEFMGVPTDDFDVPLSDSVLSEISAALAA